MQDFLDNTVFATVIDLVEGVPQVLRIGCGPVDGLV